jgi:hypothetical protein
MNRPVRFCLLFAWLTVGCRTGRTHPNSSAWQGLARSMDARALSFQCGRQQMELGADRKPTTVLLCVSSANDTTISKWSTARSLVAIRRDWVVRNAIADSALSIVVARLDREFGGHQSCRGAPNIAMWKADGYFVALASRSGDIPGLPCHINVDRTVYPPQC